MEDLGSRVGLVEKYSIAVGSTLIIDQFIAIDNGISPLPFCLPSD
jgi:hypothetical protein